MKQLLIDANVGVEELSSPAVLSCGGMYLPHRRTQQQVLYHIINTPSVSEPVKIVCGARPRNFLHEVLIKESMN
jgi:hypothetical protein